MTDWREEKLGSLRYRVAALLMGDDYEVAHSGHIWPGDDSLASADAIIEMMAEEREDLVSTLRSEISLLSCIKPGCGCCRDWHRERQESRAELAEELLKQMGEKHD